LVLLRSVSYCYHLDVINFLARRMARGRGQHRRGGQQRRAGRHDRGDGRGQQRRRILHRQYAGSAARAIMAVRRWRGDAERVRVISPAAAHYAGFQSTLYDWLTTTLPITGQLVYPEAGSLAGQVDDRVVIRSSITNTQIMSGHIALLNWTEPRAVRRSHECPKTPKPHVISAVILMLSF